MPKKGESEDDDDVSITDDVRGADYYHGLIPKTDVEPLLKKEGDFLLRKTELKPDVLWTFSLGEIVLAISVRHENGVRHFMVNQDADGSFYCEHHHEKSVSDLVSFYTTTKTPLSSSSGVRLKRPIERPQWLLNHDAIRLVKKLGEGAFEMKSGKTLLLQDTPASVTKLVVHGCWAKSPNDRPEFSKIVKTLKAK
ncbi:unnamed protein product [Anisakis simplex]|uniref:SH2 domain-containing protein n=1 Tax=Anisakis simplex TaxID=6269 RepID=A0A0M3JZM6_ANISI|nr:unnamed protein product [Anisakis simplex]